MALKNIFDMVKADRYTADGCAEIKKAREADVEDRVYNIGEISQKTGLQKTANGWVKPKTGNAGSAKKDASGADVLNNKYYKNDVRTEEGEKKILSEPETPSVKATSQEDLLAKKRKWDIEGGPSNETERAEYDKLRSQINYKLPDEKSSFGTDVSRMKKLKQQDPREFSIQLEKLHSKYPGDKWQNLYKKATSDSAPRVLTGDTKIRIRK